MTYPSKTAHLVSRLEKIASTYALQSDYAKANDAKGSISDLRGAKMGGPQFALLEKRTYGEAIALGIEWDDEWIPKGVTKKPTQPTETYLVLGQTLKLGKYNCTVDKNDGYYLNNDDGENELLFTQFGLTQQDVRSYSGEGRDSHVFPEMLSRKRLTEVYNWLKEHEKPTASRTPHADYLRYDKMRSYLCSRISEIRLAGINIHERNAADGFLLHLREENHLQTYRAAMWIEGMCKKYGITWSPSWSLIELKEYLNGLYGDQKQHLAGGESMQYESSIVVRLGNPCSEIELPMDSLPSNGLAYIRETQELNPMHLI